MSADYESGAGRVIVVANSATGANEIDWHGLGRPVTVGASVDVVLREAGLDWQVVQRPVYVDGREVPNMAACVRDSDDKVLYIGDAKRNKIDYRQNVDVLTEMDSIASKLGLELSYACSIKGGGNVLFTYAHPSMHRIDPTGSPVQSFLTCDINRSAASRTLHGLETEIREVCSNTRAAAIHAANKSGRQARIISSARISEGDIAAMLEMVHANLVERTKLDELMANDKLSDGEAVRLFATVAGINLAELEMTRRNERGEVVPMVSTKARNILAALDLSYRNAPGATPGTAFGALNAISHYTSHVRTCRDTQGDGDQGARVAANLIGDGAAMVNKATALLSARYAMAA